MKKGFFFYYHVIFLLLLFLFLNFSCDDAKDNEDQTEDNFFKDDDVDNLDGDLADSMVEKDDSGPVMAIFPAVFIAADCNNELLLFRERLPSGDDVFHPFSSKDSLAGPFDGHTSIALGWTDIAESGWETVAKNIDYPILKVDHQNNMHLVYLNRRRGKPDRIFYGNNITGEWSATQIDTGSTWSLDMALDRQGHAHVAYNMNRHDNDLYSIEYATNATGPWNVKTAISGSYSSPSIDIDHNNIVWMAATGNKGVSVIHSSLGNWKEEVVAREFDFGFNKLWFANPDIGIGPAGFVQVAYKFKKEWRSGYPPAIYCNPGVRLEARILGFWFSQWEAKEGGGTGDAVEAPKLLIDPSGARHMVYLLNGDLLYASESNGSWVIQEVLDWCYNCIGWDIVIDKKGVAHISFVNNKSLAYANNSSGQFELRTWE